MDNLPYVPASELNQATNVNDDDPMTGSVQAPTNALATLLSRYFISRMGNSLISREGS